MTIFPAPRYIAGVGCRKGAGADEIVALIMAVLSEAGISLDALNGIGTLRRKTEEPGLQAAAQRLGVPLRAFSFEALSNLLPPSSGPVMDTVGLPGVAEAVALRAGALVVPKRKSANVTCALGRYRSSAAMASSTLATSVAGP